VFHKDEDGCVYSTPVTTDVERGTEEEILAMLKAVEELPPRG
jgi:hypothetical protein